MRKWLLLLLCVMAEFAFCADLPQILPYKLNKGDLIALVFPASYIDADEDKARETVQRKAKWLTDKGYRTVLYPSKIRPKGYLAGTDKERAKAFMDAWRNPEVKAIWCFRGGWGTPRMLDFIDYPWIKSHPKILIGMSDITALHHAIQIKTGLITFLGPVLNYFDEGDSDFNQEYAFSELENIVLHRKSGPIHFPESGLDSSIIRSGKGIGRVVGGNLTLIAALCGTKWQLDTDGRILILEDIGEDIYRIDRLLWQLREAGLLENPAGVILASWKNCKPSPRSLTMDEVFETYFKNAPYPVLFGFPSGHDKYQTTVPLNAMMEIDTSKMSFKLLHPSVKSYAPK